MASTRASAIRLLTSSRSIILPEPGRGAETRTEVVHHHSTIRRGSAPRLKVSKADVMLTRRRTLATSSTFAGYCAIRRHRAGPGNQDGHRRRRSPRSSDGREETRRGALGARDLVEGSGEVHAPPRQRAEARQALHDDDAGAEDHPVHREVLRGEVGQPGAVLFKEIEADVLRAPRDQPLR